MWLIDTISILKHYGLIIKRLSTSNAAPKLTAPSTASHWPKSPNSNTSGPSSPRTAKLVASGHWSPVWQEDANLSQDESLQVNRAPSGTESQSAGQRRPGSQTTWLTEWWTKTSGNDGEWCWSRTRCESRGFDGTAMLSVAMRTQPNG